MMSRYLKAQYLLRGHFVRDNGDTQWSEMWLASAREISAAIVRWRLDGYPVPDLLVLYKYIAPGMMMPEASYKLDLVSVGLAKPRTGLRCYRKVVSEDKKWKASSYDGSKSGDM